jgi:hypothetical protein
VEFANNKTSRNQEGRGGGRRGIPSDPLEDQQGTAGGGDRRRKTESEMGRRKGAPEQWRQEWGVTLAPSSRVRFYACTAPSPALPPILPAKHHLVPAGEGSSRGGRPRPGRRRGDARGGVAKWCESGNQTWASCTASSRMGL